jgi:hypothetical protein
VVLLRKSIPQNHNLQTAVEHGVKRESMITQQITAITLRIFSIWLLIQVILNLPSLVMLFASIGQYRQQEIPVSVYIGLIALFTVVGLIAVFLLHKAAVSVLGHSKKDTETTLSNESQKMVFQVLGLYFIVTALAYLPRSLSFIPNTIEINVLNILWPIGLLFQLAIGLWLVSNSSYWSNFFRKLRAST